MDAPSINVLALPIGYELDGYRIERVLGAGGFGITYLATETLLGRMVAIKEFLPTGIATRGTDGHSVRPITGENHEVYRWGIDRFRQEAKTLVSFQHPNVVAIERYFEANGTAYLVMQYIEGKSLGNVLREFQTIEAGEILELLLPLLDGLAHVHDAGFLHRDIKPDNIFISAEGRPILIDFGAARQALGQQSKSLTAIVSEGYAPYEQYEAHGNQGPWTDIYAVGAVMYRCMTGEKPLAAPSRVAAKFRGRPDPLPAIAAVAKGTYSNAMMAMAERALAVNEDDRPQTVAELLAMLKEAGPEPAPPPSEAPTGMAPDRTLVAADIRPPPPAREGALAPPAREQPAPRRRRIAPALIAAGVGALLVAGASAAWIGGAFSPGLDEASTAALRDAERQRADEARRAEEAERQRRAEEEQRRRAEEEAKRKAAEDARKAEEDRKKAEDEQRRKAEEERKKAEEDRRKADEEAAKRRAEEERRKAEEAEQRRKAEEERRKTEEEAATRRADEDRKKAEEDRKKAEEDRQRRADAERDAEQKRRAEEERAKAARLKGLVDRAGAQLRQARAQIAQNRLPEARRSIEEAREAAAGALQIEPASAEAKGISADADALAGELRTRIAARIKELAAGAERDVEAGRVADAARKIAEIERLDSGAAELASLRSDLRALRARQEEALRRRREDEARRRAEAERARPPPAAPRPAQPRPAQPAQPYQPPARAPERRIPIPP